MISNIKKNVFQWILFGALAVTPFMMPEVKAEYTPTEDEIAGVSVRFGGGRHHGRHYGRHYGRGYDRGYYRHNRYPRYYRHHYRPYYNDYYYDDYYGPRGSIQFKVK